MGSCGKIDLKNAILMRTKLEPTEMEAGILSDEGFLTFDRILSTNEVLNVSENSENIKLLAEPPWMPPNSEVISTHLTLVSLCKFNKMGKNYSDILAPWSDAKSRARTTKKFIKLDGRDWVLHVYAIVHAQIKRMTKKIWLVYDDEGNVYKERFIVGYQFTTNGPLVDFSEYPKEKCPRLKADTNVWIDNSLPSTSRHESPTLEMILERDFSPRGIKNNGSDSEPDCFVKLLSIAKNNKFTFGAGVHMSKLFVYQRSTILTKLFMNHLPTTPEINKRYKAYVALNSMDWDNCVTSPEAENVLPSTVLSNGLVLFDVQFGLGNYNMVTVLFQSSRILNGQTGKHKLLPLASYLCSISEIGDPKHMSLLLKYQLESAKPGTYSSEMDTVITSFIDELLADLTRLHALIQLRTKLVDLFEDTGHKLWLALCGHFTDKVRVTGIFDSLSMEDAKHELCWQHEMRIIGSNEFEHCERNFKEYWNTYVDKKIAEGKSPVGFFYNPTTDEDLISIDARSIQSWTEVMSNELKNIEIDLKTAIFSNKASIQLVDGPLCSYVQWKVIQSQDRTKFVGGENSQFSFLVEEPNLLDEIQHRDGDLCDFSEDMLNNSNNKIHDLKVIAIDVGRWVVVNKSNESAVVLYREGQLHCELCKEKCIHTLKLLMESIRSPEEYPTITQPKGDDQVVTEKSPVKRRNTDVDSGDDPKKVKNEDCDIIDFTNILTDEKSNIVLFE